VGAAVAVQLLLASATTAELAAATASAQQQQQQLLTHLHGLGRAGGLQRPALRGPQGAAVTPLLLQAMVTTALAAAAAAADYLLPEETAVAVVTMEEAKAHAMAVCVHIFTLLNVFLDSLLHAPTDRMQSLPAAADRAALLLPLGISVVRSRDIVCHSARLQLLFVLLVLLSLLQPQRHCVLYTAATQ
jgi:hypothetical protein